MGFTIFSKLFHKKQKHDTKIFSLLEEYAKTKEYFFFQNITIYHRSNSINIPAMLFIPKIGIVLFSIKSWNFSNLQKTTLKKVPYLQDNENTLAFDNIHHFIKEKLLDIAQIEKVDFINFAILTELTFEEYQLLNESVKALLPQEKIFFKQTTLEEIQQRFANLQTKEENYNPNEILPYLCNEYMIIDNRKIFLANIKQREFIDNSLSSLENIQASRSTGKSHLILLKAIKEKLHNPQIKIAIVVPTKFHTYILKQLLLQLVEKSCIVIDMSEILFFTQSELLQYHANKLNKKIFSHHKVDPILMKKDFFLADIIFCDDAHTFDEEFLIYLEHLQKRHQLIYINATKREPTYTLKTHYHKTQIKFQDQNTTSHLLREIYTLLKDHPEDSILIFTKIQTEEDNTLIEDITSFTGIKASIVHQNETQTFFSSQIQIAPLNNSIPLRAEFCFIITTDETDLSTLTYLLYSSKKTTFVLYNTENKTLQDFHKEFNEKDNQN